MRADLRSIAQAAGNDPAKALLAAAGDLSDYDVFHNYVLVATYIPSEKTPGGIIMPDRSLAESRFQGKVGLVLKIGPTAFKDDDTAEDARFGGITISKGDWVVSRASDGVELFIRDRRTKGDGLPVKLIEDTLIKVRVTDPSLVY